MCLICREHLLFVIIIFFVDEKRDIYGYRQEKKRDLTFKTKKIRSTRESSVQRTQPPHLLKGMEGAGGKGLKGQ